MSSVLAIVSWFLLILLRLLASFWPLLLHLPSLHDTLARSLSTTAVFLSLRNIHLHMIYTHDVVCRPLCLGMSVSLCLPVSVVLSVSLRLSLAPT